MASNGVVYPPHPAARAQPCSIGITKSGDIRIAQFYGAFEDGDVHRFEDDKLEYRAPNDEPLSFASDMFSVGVTLFEMATGKLPDSNNLDQLLATIEDDSKREVISLAYAEPTKRSTADEHYPHNEQSRSLPHSYGFLSPASANVSGNEQGV